MMEAKKAQFSLFVSAFAKLQNSDLAENAAQEIMSPRLSGAWKTLNLAHLDQDHIFRCLSDGLYEDAVDSLKAAHNEAMKRNTAMKKKATKKTTEATASKTTAKKVKKVVTAEAATPAVKKAPAEKSRYGHRVGSSADFMDNLLWAGCDPDKGAEQLATKFGLDVAKAKAKLLVHVRYLKKEREVAFTTYKDSPKLKSKTEKIVWPKAK